MKVLMIDMITKHYFLLRIKSDLSEIRHVVLVCQHQHRECVVDVESDVTAVEELEEPREHRHTHAVLV